MQNLTVIISICLGLLFGWAAQAQNGNWVKTDLGEGVSINYPGTPSKREMNSGIILYRFKTADSMSVLTVMIRDLSSLGFSAEQLEEASTTPEFWDQIQASSVQAISNTKLLKSQRLEFQQKLLLELDLEFLRDNKTNILSQRIFIKGLKSYTVNFNSLEGKGDPTIKATYFDSLSF
jgi:hypothetical protein